MGPGNSLIPTQLHCLQDCSLYWDGLIPGTKARGPAERHSLCYQNMNVTTGDHVTSRRSHRVSWSDLLSLICFSCVLSVFRSAQQIMIMGYGWIDHFMCQSLRSAQITFCRCMFLVSCSSSMFCSFLFISLRFSSPGFTRSLRTEPRPPRSPWEVPWPPTALPDTSEEDRGRYWADPIGVISTETDKP